MARVTLITGGNMGDVKTRLQRAQMMINDEIGPVMRCSHRYKSEAWGFPSADLFTNQVLIADTDLTPHEVLGKVQWIERALGRDRGTEEQLKTENGEQYSSRVIDVDILFYDDVVVDTPELKIPHPLLHKRVFVLEPLNEILRDKRHPVLNKTVGELWAEAGEHGKGHNSEIIKE